MIRGSRLLHAFSSMLAAQLVAAGLGYLFWVVAARALSKEGIAGGYSATATMMLLGTVGMLGYGTYLVDALQSTRARQKRRLLQHALVVVTVSSLLLGVAWVLISPFLSETLRHATPDLATKTLLVLGVVGTALSLMLDQATLGLRQPTLQVTRNLLASVVKFPLLLALVLIGWRGSSVVLVAWVVPLWLSILFLLWRAQVPRAKGEQDGLGSHLRAEVGTVLSNHVLNLALGATSLLMPVIAAVLLVPHDYAVFSLVWLVATFAFLVPYLLAVALFATAVGDVDAYRRQARRTLPLSLALALAMIAAVGLLAPVIMGIFGSGYVDLGADLLRLALLAVLMLIVKDHYFALLRVRRQLTFGGTVALGTMALEIGGATVGGLLLGPLGLVLGWLAGLGVQILFMAWPLIRTLSHSPAEKQARSTGTPATPEADTAGAGPHDPPVEPQADAAPTTHHHAVRSRS